MLLLIALIELNILLVKRKLYKLFVVNDLYIICTTLMKQLQAILRINCLCTVMHKHLESCYRQYHKKNNPSPRRFKELTTRIRIIIILRIITILILIAVLVFIVLIIPTILIWIFSKIRRKERIIPVTSQRTFHRSTHRSARRHWRSAHIIRLLSGSF